MKKREFQFIMNHTQLRFLNLLIEFDISEVREKDNSE